MSAVEGQVRAVEGQAGDRGEQAGQQEDQPAGGGDTRPHGATLERV